MRLKNNFWIASLFILMVTGGCSEDDLVTTPQRSDSSGELFDGIINDELNGVPIVIYGNSAKNFFASFERRAVDENEILIFERSGQPFPNVLKDQYGKVWNVFGQYSEDFGNSRLLKGVDNLVGYWFSFPSFKQKILLTDGVEIINPSAIEKEEGDWLINEKNVFAGTLRDGIKSIDQPQYLDFIGKDLVDDAFYQLLPPEELLTLIKVDKDFYAYPHRILEYHEVVNDKVGALNVVISFCPLTGTSRVWDRQIHEKTTEFGVSGLLFNNNLIMYDRTSDSFWSQILNKSVFGPYRGEAASSFQTWEIKFEDIVNIEGRVKVLSPQTGHNYEYQYPLYGAYKYNDRVNFPLSFSDDRIPPKERVIGVTIGDITKVYRFSDFD
ncbi:MAG: DUF3179 domain-containing protein [Cytophagales bacterium]|nr:DUF3179 domain-containing protein [Cytophagales bacterium]